MQNDYDNDDDDGNDNIGDGLYNASKKKMLN